MSIGREALMTHAARALVRDLACPAALLPALLSSAHAGETLLVSAATDGTPGDGESGSIFGTQAISASGRYVVFESFALDLVAEDTNGDWDIFRRDRLKGTTVRVTVQLSGDPALGGGLNASASASGRYVAFQSTSASHVEGRPQRPKRYLRARREEGRDDASVRELGRRRGGRAELQSPSLRHRPLRGLPVGGG